MAIKLGDRKVVDLSRPRDLGAAAYRAKIVFVLARMPTRDLYVVTNVLDVLR